MDCKFLMRFVVSALEAATARLPRRNLLLGAAPLFAIAVSSCAGADEVLVPKTGGHIQFCGDEVMSQKVQPAHARRPPLRI